MKMIKRNGAAPKVFIQGLGYAGASAAVALQEAGFDVTVAEREGHGGGRARSVRTPGSPGFIADVGAQFYVSHYHRVRYLADKVGLWSDAVELDNNLAILREGKLRRMTSDPMSIYWEGLLGSTKTTPSLTMANPISYMIPQLGLVWGLMEKAARAYVAPEARAGRTIVRAFNETAPMVSHLPSDNYSAWSRFDDETSARWLHKHYGIEGTNYLVQPLLDGLFFQQPEDMSKVIPLWMLGILARRERWYVMRNGTQSLVNALAKILKDVRFNCEMQSVIRQDDGSVRVDTNQGLFNVDAVILTAPPLQSRNILKSPTSLQQELMGQDYAPGIVVNLLTSRRWNSMPKLSGVHMVLIPRAERQVNDAVAAFSLESGKHKAIGNQDLIGAHMTSRLARTMMGWSDDAIARKVIGEVGRVLPGISSSIVDVKIQRWENAIPHCDMGKTFLLSRFWEEQRKGVDPVYFAGDGTSFPTLEAAAWSGNEAAKCVVNMLGKRH
jgi:protoporphyrinogen/coproporphyrinogen III oxidase